MRQPPKSAKQIKMQLLFYGFPPAQTHTLTVVNCVGIGIGMQHATCSKQPAADLAVNENRKTFEWTTCFWFFSFFFCTHYHCCCYFNCFYCEHTHTHTLQLSMHAAHTCHWTQWRKLQAKRKIKPLKCTYLRRRRRLTSLHFSSERDARSGRLLCPPE